MLRVEMAAAVNFRLMDSRTRASTEERIETGLCRALASKLTNVLGVAFSGQWMCPGWNGDDINPQFKICLAIALCHAMRRDGRSHGCDLVLEDVGVQRKRLRGGDQGLTARVPNPDPPRNIGGYRDFPYAEPSHRLPRFDSHNAICTTRSRQLDSIPPFRGPGPMTF
jgi:hypothetical protein